MQKIVEKNDSGRLFYQTLQMHLDKSPLPESKIINGRLFILD
ncbi:hypothetical protein [Nostoc sp.]